MTRHFTVLFAATVLAFIGTVRLSAEEVPAAAKAVLSAQPEQRQAALGRLFTARMSVDEAAVLADYLAKQLPQEARREIVIDALDFLQKLVLAYPIAGESVAQRRTDILLMIRKRDDAVSGAALLVFVTTMRVTNGRQVDVEREIIEYSQRGTADSTRTVLTALYEANVSLTEPHLERLLKLLDKHPQVLPDWLSLMGARRVFDERVLARAREALLAEPPVDASELPPDDTDERFAREEKDAEIADAHDRQVMAAIDFARQLKGNASALAGPLVAMMARPASSHRDPSTIRVLFLCDHDGREVERFYAEIIPLLSSDEARGVAKVLKSLEPASPYRREDILRALAARETTANGLDAE